MARKRPVAQVVGLVADRDSANKYGIVLLLLCVSYVASVYADGAEGIAIVMLVQLLTLWLTFSASESRRAQRLAGVACLATALLVVAAALFNIVYSFDASVTRWLALVSVLLYLVAPLVILRHLVRRPTVDLRTVLGAVCIYVMLGMMFAFSYRAISVWQTDPAFFGAAGRGDNADFLFFSFITLTTTGYGNLVPAVNPGQSVAVLEAIVGQLFLVTALAKIVNAWRVPAFNAPDQPPGT
ncbi:MAG: potassium channel family protein [Candidatus Nanopelagicales bacterium]